MAITQQEVTTHVHLVIKMTGAQAREYAARNGSDETVTGVRDNIRSYALTNVQRAPLLEDVDAVVELAK
jgi:hypothetical protein